MKGILIQAFWMFAFLAVAYGSANHFETQSSTSPVASPKLSTLSGLTMQIAEEYAGPSLWLSILGESSGRHAVLILLPEHLTVRRHHRASAEHLYLWQPGKRGGRTRWRLAGDALEYERDFASGIHFLVRASLRADGVLVHYELLNNSYVDFDSVQAITDPRMLSPLLHDVRLERTYVHEPGGFVLLAADMPDRVKMPLKAWLPNRYRISYSWPVENERVQRQPDGVTIFNAPNRADIPVIATLSNDGRWIMATFSRNPGNLWTNPDLTCQHADMEIPLPHQSTGVIEEKILLFRGTLEDLLPKVTEQRDLLK